MRGRNSTNLVSKTLRQSEAVSRVLAGLPEAKDVPVSRMLVFVESQWGFLAPPFDLDGVWIGPPKPMARMVSRPGPLDSDTVQLIASRLADGLKPA